MSKEFKTYQEAEDAAANKTEETGEIWIPCWVIPSDHPLARLLPNETLSEKTVSRAKVSP